MAGNKSFFSIIHLICSACILYFNVGCAQTQSVGTNNTMPPVKLSGCYSSLYYNEEGGDLLGEEVFIIPSANGNYMLYQESEGAPTVLELLPVYISKNNVRFFVPSRGQQYGFFEGIITMTNLSGKFIHTENTLNLPKKPSYWTENTPAKQITGIYSNMHYDDRAKGIYGDEITIVYSRNGYYDLYQQSTGKPAPPMLQVATVKGNSLSFALQRNGNTVDVFTGTLTQEGLVGNFQNSHKIIRLPRTNSFWE